MTILKGIVNEKLLLALIFAAILGVLLFNLYTLTTYPPLFIDESWYANVAWNWLTQGKNYDSMHTLARQDISWPYLGNLPWLVSFAIAGLGLTQARIVAWFFGLILVVGTFFVGRLNFGRMVGALAALFLVLSPAFMQASHYARPDVMLAAFGMFSYLLLVAGFKTEKCWLHLSAGILIGLSLDIHLNAIIYIFGFLILYLYQYKLKIFRTTGFWLFVLGGFLSLIYYVVVHILPNPGEFFDYYRYSLGSEHQMPLASFNPMVLLRSFRAEIGRYHFFENGLTFALLGASIVYLVWRRKLAEQYLLIFTAAAFIGFVLFAGNKHDIYAILLYPFFLLILSEGLIGLVQSSKGVSPNHAYFVALISLYLISSLVVMTRPVIASRAYDYYAVTDKVRKVVPPGSKVMGLPNWWLGLADYDYRSVMGLTYLHFLQNTSLKEGLEILEPDYLIFDTGLNGLLVNEGYFGEYGFDVYNMPRREFESFLADQGEKLEEFTNPWHGDFRIYKIIWGN